MSSVRGGVAGSVAQARGAGEGVRCNGSRSLVTPVVVVPRAGSSVIHSSSHLCVSRVLLVLLRLRGNWERARGRRRARLEHGRSTRLLWKSLDQCSHD